MEGFLQSLDSPCSHAPQRSCLKQRENTVKTELGRWNPYSPSDSLTTFFSYNLLAEDRHLSLPPPTPTCRSNSDQSGYSEGTTATNRVIPQGTAASSSAIPAPCRNNNVQSGYSARNSNR